MKILYLLRTLIAALILLQLSAEDISFLQVEFFGSGRTHLFIKI